MTTPTKEAPPVLLTPDMARACVNTGYAAFSAIAGLKALGSGRTATFDTATHMVVPIPAPDALHKSVCPFCEAVFADNVQTRMNAGKVAIFDTATHEAVPTAELERLKACEAELREWADAKRALQVYDTRTDRSKQSVAYLNRIFLAQQRAYELCPPKEDQSHD